MNNLTINATMGQKFRRYCCLSALATLSLTACSGAADGTPPLRLVFLGDSLTAGYHLDTDQAFPALIQNRIRAAALPIEVLNSGISGDTTSGGRSRLNWLLRRPIHLLVVALGANDGLRGIDPALAEANLDAIIRTTRERYPDCVILLAGIKLPPNMGDDYVQRFERIYTRLAETHALTLMPFLLQDVAGKPHLNLDDGIHPNAEGHLVIAANLWPLLEPTLRQLVSSNTSKKN